MRPSRAKSYTFAILFVALLIGVFNSVYSTGFVISDTDPSSYIIVVMLMLFVLVLFSMKEELEPAYTRFNLIAGSALFVGYVLLLIYARGALSYLYWSYRIDALLIPLLLLSFIVLLFGKKGVSKLKLLPIFALFASPVILMPLLAQNPLFANLNATFVYSIVRAVGVPVVLHGLSVVAPSGATISINTTCVPLGTFIALVLFLVPVAYFYSGKVSNKLLWLLSGAALVLALNLLRMLLISLVWASYGIGTALGVFHLFAGQIIFYASIVVMILLAHRYGMQLPRLAKVKRKRSAIAKQTKRQITALAAIVLCFAVIVFILSIPYQSVKTTPAILFDSFNYSAGMNNTAQNYQLLSAQGFSRAGVSAVQVANSTAGGVFLLESRYINNTAYAVTNVSTGPELGGLFVSYNSIHQTGAYILRNGVTINSGIAISQNHTFGVDYFTVPYSYKGNLYAVSYIVFRPLNASSQQSCRLATPANIGSINYLESTIYNAMHGRLGTGVNNVACQSYSIASSA